MNRYSIPLNMSLLLVYACLCSVTSLAAAPESEPASKTAQSPAAAQSDADTGILIVVSEGTGPDVEAAKLDAYRNAVRQAVGTYVDATTIVANDKLITDEIIVLSGAFISKAEVLTGSITKDGPFTRLRVKSEVETGKVLTALHKRQVKTSSEIVVLDTDSIIGELSTKEDQLRSADKLLEKLFDGYPQKCFRVSIVGAPKPTKQEGDNVELLCRMRIETDVKAWAEFSRALRTVLGAISISQTTHSVSVGNAADMGRGDRGSWSGYIERGNRGMFDRKTLDTHRSVLGQEAICLDMKAIGRKKPDEKDPTRSWISCELPFRWPDEQGFFVAPPKQHFMVAVLVSDPTGGGDGEEHAWEEYAVPNTLGIRFPKRWNDSTVGDSEASANSAQFGVHTNKTFEFSRLRFALVQDDSGKQIELYNGYCSRVGLCWKEATAKFPHLVAPCFFLWGEHFNVPAGIATGVEFTVKCNMPRAVLERHPAIRAVLK